MMLMGLGVGFNSGVHRFQAHTYEDEEGALGQMHLI